MTGPDHHGIGEAWRLADARASEGGTVAARIRCASADELAHASALSVMTGWPVVAFGPDADLGTARLAALSPDGEAWLPEGRVGIPPDLARVLAARAPGGGRIRSELARRFGDAARARHMIARVAADLMSAHAAALRPHVVALPDGAEGKLADPRTVTSDDPPSWLAEAAEALSGDVSTIAAGGAPMQTFLRHLGAVHEGERRMREVEAALAHGDPAALPRLVSVGLIRSTFAYRGTMPDAWYGFRDRMRDDLEARGLDPGRLMRGLLDRRPADARAQDLAVLDLAIGRSRVVRLADLEAAPAGSPAAEA